MIAVRVTSQSVDLKNVQELYVKAFPENERSPFHLLLDDHTKCSEILAFYEGDCFCGFMSLLSIGDISHIIYFAIDEALRKRGFGAQALALLKQIKPRNRLLADIELPSETAKNNAQRCKRKQFYIRNGYTSSGIAYEWRNEAYEILLSGGTLTEKEFWKFWESVSEINVEFAKF